MMYLLQVTLHIQNQSYSNLLKLKDNGYRIFIYCFEIKLML